MGASPTSAAPVRADRPPARGLRPAPARRRVPLEAVAAAVAGVVAVVWAVWQPPVRDLAAQLFRVDQQRDVGFHVVNTFWYGGHHTLNYSALFEPIAATLGVGATGVLAAMATAACSAALLRRWAGAAAWPGALWLAVATTTSLFTGRLAFALGAAFATAACLAAQRRRTVPTVVLGVLTGATSGVAAALTALAGLAAILGAREAAARRAAVPLAVAPACTVVALALAFPVEGDAPFSTRQLAACVAAGLAVWLAATPADRVVRTGALLYVAAGLLAFAVPTPVGGTVERLGGLVGGPLVLTLLLRRRRDGTLPAWLRRPAGVVAVAAGLLVAAGWQWDATRIDVRDALGPGEPSTRASFYAPLLRELDRRSTAPARVEIPFTAMHHEARWVARRVPIARGWLRQLDRARNPLFYDGPLTSARYERWLRASGIAWVALPDTPLDHSAVEEARIVRTRPPYLREVWRSPRWRLFSVAGSPGLASGPGRVAEVAADRVVVDARRPGRVVLRFRHTRLWEVTAGDACVGPAPGGWTALDVRRAGRVVVQARAGAPARGRCAPG
jgi:hypothetical protein